MTPGEIARARTAISEEVPPAPMTLLDKAIWYAGKADALRRWLVAALDELEPGQDEDIADGWAE